MLLDDSSQAFSRLMVGPRLALQDTSPNIVYGIWSDFSLAYFNPAWRNFATSNGGEPAISLHWNLKSCVLDAISPRLRPFFATNFQRAMDEFRPWSHIYECSSADIYRRFHMTSYPLGRREGLLVVNTLLVESTQTRAAYPPIDANYRVNGVVLQCSHCRRFKRIAPANTWDWVPYWITNPRDDYRLGLCDACLGFYLVGRRPPGNTSTRPFLTGEPE